MRVFFAVPLPDPLKEELAGLQARLRPTVETASWPDPGGLHVTLAFLGQRPEASAPDLLAVAGRALAGHGVFRLRTTRLGGFPKDRAARILWLGLAEQPALDALAEALRAGLRTAGEAFDDRPFRAHLTLARFRTPQEVARFGPPGPPMDFDVREVLLFESRQTPAGSRYLALGRVPLRP